MMDSYTPRSVKVLERFQETANTVTLRLGFTATVQASDYAFKPGQFNMLCCDEGEIPISIAGASEQGYFEHTISILGRVSQHLSLAQQGDYLALRGPFGQGWPLDKSADLLIITGGIGAAPLLPLVNHYLSNPHWQGHLYLLHGIRDEENFLFRKQFEAWQGSDKATVLLSANRATDTWQGEEGLVTERINDLPHLDFKKLTMLSCGPEVMMKDAIKRLEEKGLQDENIYISLERNMHCGIGHCGHCQIGGQFVCKNGPVFAYPKLKRSLQLGL
ncbi:MAG: FAD/NAD(P)-binding protein [Gammaproteobacteria bacterium]|nr:FAD/NAD(P)-binding protein [Gammaproteobacteria bacterium]MCF6229494.1 FAD/NAD(P)-binding protein [Gammaproteobacteria bacterium]